MNKFETIEAKEHGRSGRSMDRFEEFYRRCPDLLLEISFGIKLKWWQKVIIRIMGMVKY